MNVNSQNVETQMCVSVTTAKPQAENSSNILYLNLLFRKLLATLHFNYIQFTVVGLQGSCRYHCKFKQYKYVANNTV